MKNSIIDAISYFNYFKYPPTTKEIFLYMSKKTSYEVLENWLKRLEKNRIIIKNDDRYTLGGYGKNFTKWTDREALSLLRLKKIEWFIKIIAIFPQIMLIGISGGLSMLNSGIDDDIDVFIISAKNRIWTARIIVLSLSSLFGLRRVFGSKKVKEMFCFNLFFDISHMRVADRKKNRYVAHEILQMKPLFVRNDTYRAFLESNKWVEDFFPNLKIEGFKVENLKFQIQSSKDPISKSNIVGEFLEKMFRDIQLNRIDRHKTNEMISDHQLWFFPDDFQNKIKKLI